MSNSILTELEELLRKEALERRNRYLPPGDPGTVDVWQHATADELEDKEQPAIFCKSYAAPDAITGLFEADWGTATQAELICFLHNNAHELLRMARLGVAEVCQNSTDCERIACYDMGPEGTVDRYTVVYLGQPERDGLYAARGMSSDPFHPQGFGQMTTAQLGGHMGKRIAFKELPADCQKLVLQDLGLKDASKLEDTQGNYD